MTNYTIEEYNNRFRPHPNKALDLPIFIWYGTSFDIYQLCQVNRIANTNITQFAYINLSNSNRLSEPMEPDQLKKYMKSIETDYKIATPEEVYSYVTLIYSPVKQPTPFTEE